MADFFEIDFLDVESKKSGDAIPLRYEISGLSFIHVVDGGFQDTGDSVVSHIKKYYGDPAYIDHVVLTHNDNDHAGGLRTVLESFKVGALWMLRPWDYAEELLPRFSRYSTVDNLKKRLRELYPNIAALEEIAESRGITVREPFQGSKIGAFTVMAPTRPRYLDLLLQSEKTPDAVTTDGDILKAAGRYLMEQAAKVVKLVKAGWGAEVFSADDTSAENDMSIVQYANLCNTKILLTGDAGRAALMEAADYAPYVGLTLPGIHKFQVPHHGSRRNVSTEVLDRWLGPRLAVRPAEGQETFTAIISSAKADEDHPRKAVIRACMHRGGRVKTTEGFSFLTKFNAPDRAEYSGVTYEAYPSEQEV